MSAPCKIVTLTPEERDSYRTLRDAQAQAIKAFQTFVERLKLRHGPETRRYAPFEKVEMTVMLDDKLDGPGHAYFTKELE